VFGAIVMYIVSMASLFKLRRTEPMLERPFSAPAYPVFPAFALVAAVICLATMVYFNALVAAVFAGLAVLGYAYFLTTRSRRGDALARAAPLAESA
jgi:ethanolamine permease